nr:EFR1 family ferrodoxin [uncultured Ruminococcus sp.]
MVIYFSGTGNSRFAAQRIAAATGDELFDCFDYIREKKGADFTQASVCVFVAPVYVSAPPLVFTDFLSRSRFSEGCPAYFVMTCAGAMGAAPVYCRKIASEKRMIYLGTAQVKMPQNYLPYFKTGTDEENEAKIEAALPVIDAIADAVGSSRELPDPKTKTWERLSTPLVLKPYYKLFVSAKAFKSTDGCIGCGKCASVCPLENITMRDKKPVWKADCTHCMACINLCPKDAIEYGKRTSGKPRYHGPESAKKSAPSERCEIPGNK